VGIHIQPLIRGEKKIMGFYMQCQFSFFDFNQNSNVLTNLMTLPVIQFCENRFSHDEQRVI
jgi:hypothetical protein